jgi:hypothetical protein
VIVAATTQTPKAIIPAEINRESTVSMIGSRSLDRKVGPPAEVKSRRSLSPRGTPRGPGALTTRPNSNHRGVPELRSVRRTQRIYLMGGGDMALRRFERTLARVKPDLRPRSMSQMPSMDVASI